MGQDVLVDDHLLLVQTGVGWDGDLVIPDELADLELDFLQLLGGQWWDRPHPRGAGIREGRRGLQAQFVVARGGRESPILLFLYENLLNYVIVYRVAGDQGLELVLAQRAQGLSGYLLVVGSRVPRVGAQQAHENGLERVTRRFESGELSVSLPR